MELTRRALGAFFASLPLLRATKAQAAIDWSPIRNSRLALQPDVSIMSTETTRGHLTIGIEQTQIDGLPAGPAHLYAYDCVARPVYHVMLATFATIEDAKRNAPLAWSPSGYRLSTPGGSKAVSTTAARAEYLRAISGEGDRDAVRLTPWPDMPVHDPKSLQTREGDARKYSHEELYWLVLKQHMAHVGHVRKERR